MRVNHVKRKINRVLIVIRNAIKGSKDMMA